MQQADKASPERVEAARVVQSFVQPIEIELVTTQLQAVQPPFFPNHFTKWRKKALIALRDQYLARADVTFAQRQACLTEFYARVNVDLRRRFVEKLKKPYLAIIESKDPDFGDGHRQQPGAQRVSADRLRNELGLGDELSLMTQRVAEWCIQMEIAEDMKEVAFELGLIGGGAPIALAHPSPSPPSTTTTTTAALTPTNGTGSDTISSERLEGQLLELVRGRCKERLGYQMQAFVQGYVAEQVEGFSRVVTERGWRSSNLSYETYMSLYLRVMGTGGLPISMILPQYALLYVAGGVLGAALVKRVGQWLHSSSVQDKLAKATKGYWESAVFLQDFNMRCQQAVLRCVNAGDEEHLLEERRNLRRDFEHLIYNPEELTAVIEQEAAAREIRVEQRPDGIEKWVLVDKPPERAVEGAPDAHRARANTFGRQSVVLKRTKPFKEVPIPTLPGWVEWQ